VSVSPCPTCHGEGQIIAQPCEVCRGDGRVRGERTVKVDVPAGVSSDNYLTLRGRGAAGPRGGAAGDLIVALDVADDERFERQGEHLIHDLPVSFAQAALGDTVTVPSPWGDERIEIEPGTQAGSVIRLRNKGLPRVNTEGRGDLHIRIHLWTPERLTDEQARLFRELRALEGDGPHQSSGFWTKLKEALGA
jgi:molecular chaperone DnaJ